MSTTIFTLNIGSSQPEPYAIAVKSIKRYAEQIGANFVEITERAFPDFPVNYEKFQIHKLGSGNDWNIYIDADVLIRDLFDVTIECPKDAVGHWGAYGADSWFEMDDVFKADTEVVVLGERICSECGAVLAPATQEIRPRNIAIAGAFVVVPSACHDVWTPLNMTASEAVKQARRSWFVAEYATARNVAANHYKVHQLRTKEVEAGAQSENESFVHVHATTSGRPITPALIRQCQEYLDGKRDDLWK